MTTKSIKLEVPFQKLLNVIDQLTPDEKLVLKKKLQKEKVSTWQERFGRVLRYLVDFTATGFPLNACGNDIYEYPKSLSTLSKTCDSFCHSRSDNNWFSLRSAQGECGAEPVPLPSAPLRENQGHETDRYAAAQPRITRDMRSPDRVLLI